MVQHDFEGSINMGAGSYCGSRSFEDNMSHSYMQNHWAQLAETTMPLTASKLATANQASFQVSLEIRSRQISNKVILINLISLLVNLLLAAIAFYFSFNNNSSSTAAFAADCVLDLISSAIILWRYHGDLNSVFMEAREQIACIYLGALFEVSALAIIIKAISDITSGTDLASELQSSGSGELVYLAIAATIACSLMTVFKCYLYRLIRDRSILLDVINALISTIFAMSIVMSQALINVDPTFWYLDPVLSIILAVFMAGFGIKVIHQNFHILKPADCSGQMTSSSRFTSSGYQNLDGAILLRSNQKNSTRGISNYGSNLANSILEENSLNMTTWQKTDYSNLKFA